MWIFCYFADYLILIRGLPFLAYKNFEIIALGFGNQITLSYICLTMKDSKTESITFRTTKELKAALQQMADKDKRTLSNTIELLLEEAVKTSTKKK